MNGRFFITGLPRSRTAWMAAYCSQGRTLCFHEPITQIESLHDLRRLYDSPYYDHIGISDSGLGFHIGWILEHLKPRTLIIDRPRRDVEKSLKRLGFPATNQAALLERELDRWSDHPLVRTVPYALLDRGGTMERLWAHLMPGAPFDRVRFESFCDLNIQADLTKTRARVAERQPYIDKILGDVFAQLEPC